ncbi:MAG: tetratricopeptide repeat protein [Candidatus Methylumidiphilus sp.]
MKTTNLLLATALASGLGLAYAADHPELSEGDEAYSAENFPKAAALYRKDAELGVIAAQVNLAIMYLDGQGVQQDSQQAAKWFSKAADQGNVEAQYNLGVLYQDGKGVDKNLVEAAKWFHLAKAFKSVESIEKTMTPEQVAESRKRVNAWVDNYNISKGH